MRVVITGATSMIGIALIDVCLRNKYEVLAIVRNNTGRKDRLPVSNLIKIEYADLDHISEIKGDGVPYDVFYHFAWANTSKERRNDPIAQAENIHAALEAVKAAKRLGCRKFVGAGSQAEYGIVNDIINENTPTNPISAYGISKLATGLLSKKLCEQLGIEHVWGRIFSVYGPHDNEGTMLNTAIDNFLSGKTAHFSAATQMWNYLYESDAGEMFFRLGIEDTHSGIWLIANHESHVLKEYIQQIIDLFGSEVSYVFHGESTMLTPSLNVDMSRTCEQLNYYPKVSFQQGLAETIKARRCLKHI